MKDPRPVANSPENAVRRLVWGWAHRDTVAASSALTDDFVFAFQPTDSAGAAYFDRPWLLPDEEFCVRHLFVGGGDVPPASDIQITIDNSLVVAPDPRPGHEPAWHRTVNTHVDLKVTVTDASGTPMVTPIVGNALFYLVRGDSAGVSGTARPADAGRWYIERWEDLTIVSYSPREAATPSRNYTWGLLKRLYR